MGVTATGTGGLTELQEKLDPSKASYAYVRVTYSNDKESQREKFILVTWIGSGCKVMRKAKVGLSIQMRHRLLMLSWQISVHAADVKSVFRVYSIDVAAREKDDLKEDPIIVRLRKVFVLNSRPSLSQDLTFYLGWRCQLRRGVTTCHQGIYPSTALQPNTTIPVVLRPAPRIWAAHLT